MIDLIKFCATDRNRGSMSSPWSRGEWTYATNGHIAVRVPRRPDVTREDGPDLQSVMDKSPEATSMQPIPDYTRPATRPCTTCRGAGKVTLCRSCEGEGSYECGECGQDAECDDCRGKGVWTARLGDDDVEPCQDCHGEGRCAEMRVAVVEISNGVGINERYAHLIRSLPNAIIDVGGTPDSYEPLRFQFDGGDGCVVPIRFSASDPNTIRPFAKETV